MKNKLTFICGRKVRHLGEIESSQISNDSLHNDYANEGDEYLDDAEKVSCANFLYAT